MALMRSLNSAISGLRAFQTKMDVIGNNIANVDTVGFKSSRITFSEMMNQQIGSVQGSQASPQSGAQVGLGVRIASVERDFTQGGLENTGRPTDIALEGEGFFMVNQGTQPMLTRAGNFAFNREGLFVDQAGRSVQGFNADINGNIISGGATQDVRIDFENVLAPQVTQNVFVAGNLNADTSTNQMIQSQTAFTTTGGGIAALDTQLSALNQGQDLIAGDVIDFNFTDSAGDPLPVQYTYAAGDTVQEMIDAIDAGIAGEGTVSFVDGMIVLRSDQLGESQFNLTSVTQADGNFVSPGFQITQQGITGTQTISTTVYDSLGRGHTLLATLTQFEENSWRYETAFLDGEELMGGTGSGVLEFDNAGNLTTDNSFNVAYDPGNGAEPTNFTVNLGNPATGSRISQFSGSSSAKVISQDGYTEGRLVDFDIDGDGYINGIYSNGRNVQLAQLAVANIPNRNGLETLGDGLYRETVASGNISVDTAENMSATSMAERMLEGSNVDLAREFTDMITTQRAYQSNARIITTADELLVEAVNLKR